jgi:hypothetical protein
VLKIGRWGNTRHFVAIPDVAAEDKLQYRSGAPMKSAHCKYHRIPAEWQKYVMRIFMNDSLPKFKRIDPCRIKLTRTPPMCGYRLINAFGAAYIRRTKNRSSHYFVEDQKAADSLVDFLRKYCLYEGESE